MAKEIKRLVTMPKAIQDPVAEQRAAPFRFLDLPAELRNEIYKILLCTIDDSETGCMIPFRDQVHPQILRTCRRAYHEGTYIMRRFNLFVEITDHSSREDGSLEWSLQCFNIPYLILTKDQRQSFKGIVMSHFLSTTSREESHSYIILHRHLDWFCTALRYTEVTCYGNIDWGHTITLHDPYELPFPMNDDARFQPFLFLKRQEELLEPYRRLGALDRFVVTGNVNRRLKLRAEQESSYTKIIDPKDLRNIMKSFKEETTKAVNCSELAKQNELTSKVIRKIWTILKNSPFDRSPFFWDEPDWEWVSVAPDDPESDDVEEAISDQVPRLYFEIWLDLFQLTIANWQKDKRLVNSLTLEMFENSFTLCLGYGGSTWEPTKNLILALHQHHDIASQLVEDASTADDTKFGAPSETPDAPELPKQTSRIALLSIRGTHSRLLQCDGIISYGVSFARFMPS